MPVFRKKDLERYYKVLGVDGQEGLVMADIIKLDMLSELYELNDFERKLPYTADNLSKAYELLYYIVTDRESYDTIERSDVAFNCAMEIIDTLSSMEYGVPGDEEATLERTHNLKATIINGLSCAGELVKFYFLFKNSSPELVMDRIKEYEKINKEIAFSGSNDTMVPESLITLYYLMLYSKFQKNGSDFELFDTCNEVKLKNVRRLVNRQFKENVPFVETSDAPPSQESKPVGKILRMTHFELVKDQAYKKNHFNPNEDM